MVVCSRCTTVVKRIGKTGMCRGCTDAVKLDGDVRRARVELGAEATSEQIAAHLKNGKLAVKIRRIIEQAA